MIPRVVHQIWIGPNAPPETCLASWRKMCASLGWEYVLWTESEMERRGFVQELAAHMGTMYSLAGRADLMRLEILYRHGGIYSDADSVCLEAFDDVLDRADDSGQDMILTRENERVRGPGFAGAALCSQPFPIPNHLPLYSNGFMAVRPGHPFMRAAIDELLATPPSQLATFPAWRTAGPGLLTRLVARLGLGPTTMVLPSYSFLPVHATGLAYSGHGKVYAHQLWSTTRTTSTSADARLPPLPTPSVAPSHRGVSLLVCSHNTPAKFLKPCIDSIQHQHGNFWIEVVWVDDGSDALHSAILKRFLRELERTSRMIRVNLLRNESNLGVAASLRRGVCACSYKRIARMDSDDIMLLDRLEKQMEWMDRHPEAVVVGAQMLMFQDGEEHTGAERTLTQHLEVVDADVLRDPSMPSPYWIMNHPTLMYRKSAVLEVGNYDEAFDGIEDYDLELRLMRRYKTLHNMPDVLVLYRLHGSQASRKAREGKLARLEALRKG